MQCGKLICCRKVPETKSMHLNCTVCASSNLQTQQFFRSSLIYFSFNIYTNTPKCQFYQVETSLQRLWLHLYVKFTMLCSHCEPIKVASLFAKPIIVVNIHATTRILLELSKNLLKFNIQDVNSNIEVSIY